MRAVISGLAPGTRVLDVACGIGADAAALQRRGLDVTAADASHTMVEQARARLRADGLDVRVEPTEWTELPQHLGLARFDVAFCVGNSIAHAPGHRAMVTAFDAFRSVLRPGGLLVLDTLDWDLVAAGGSRMTIEPHIVERNGRRCLRLHTWHLGHAADEPHVLELGLVFLDGDRAELRSHRVMMYPFSRQELRARLSAAGFTSIELDSIPGDDRYTALARRPS